MFIFVAIISIIIAMLSFNWLTFWANFEEIVNIIASIALGIGIFLTFMPQKNKSLKLDLKKYNISEVSQESFNKAVEDFYYIQDASLKTKDVELKKQLLVMQQISANILRYLKKHPDKISIARRFIDYYQDTTAKLLEKYLEIESTQLFTAEVENIKRKTKDSLNDLCTAYTQQFEKIINDRIMDMDAELKVMKQSMKADGFSTENKVNSNKYSYQHTYQQQNKPQFEDFRTTFYESSDKNKRNVKDYILSYGKKPEMNNLLGNVRRDIIRKKLIVSGLAILFGSFGAHKFYLGKPWLGALYLFFSWTTIPFLVSLIEGFHYLFMSRDEFLLKYYK